MKKKTMIVIVAVVVILIALIAIIVGVNNKSQEGALTEEYPQIAYIDNVSYYGTGNICDMVPRKTPDGMIETFVSAEIMPDAYNSANFGAEYGSLEYMFLDDGQLIIHVGEDWYYFNKQ